MKPLNWRDLWTIQRTPAVSDAAIADNPIPIRMPPALATGNSRWLQVAM